MALTIKTNHQWRHLVYRDDVPARVLASQFDHLDAEDALDGFFEYRKHWYHVSDFMLAVNPQEKLEGWHGYVSDSYFSGVLVKFSRDGERVMPATYFVKG